MYTRISTNAGLYHLQMQRACEDHAGIKYNERTTSICLCDGAGSFRYGGLAAKLISEYLPEVMQENFERFLWGRPENIRREIQAKIETFLNKCADENHIDSTELATTIMAVTIENETGKLIAFHLGDGIMLWKDKNSAEFQTLSFPKNGRTLNETWLTMNSNLYVNLEYIRWRHDSGRELLLMTDGIDPEKWEMFENMLRKNEELPFVPEDDYGYIYLRAY